jgi:hypothetical protein
MNLIDFKGIWKGAYVYEDKFQPTVVKAPIPFILKIKSIGDNGLFEGMCQDDPTASHIDFPAEVFGSLHNSRLIFNKQYSKTLLWDNFGVASTIDEPLPDIIYEAKIPDSGKILGTWKMEKTFRKINEKVMELGPMNGIWWMERF